MKFPNDLYPPTIHQLYTLITRGCGFSPVQKFSMKPNRSMCDDSVIIIALLMTNTTINLGPLYALPNHTIPHY